MNQNVRFERDSSSRDAYAQATIVSAQRNMRAKTATTRAAAGGGACVDERAAPPHGTSRGSKRRTESISKRQIAVEIHRTIITRDKYTYHKHEQRALSAHNARCTLQQRQPVELQRRRQVALVRRQHRAVLPASGVVSDHHTVSKCGNAFAMHYHTNHAQRGKRARGRTPQRRKRTAP